MGTVHVLRPVPSTWKPTVATGATPRKHGRDWMGVRPNGSSRSGSCGLPFRRTFSVPSSRTPLVDGAAPSPNVSTYELPDPDADNAAPQDGVGSRCAASLPGINCAYRDVLCALTAVPRSNCTTRCGPRNTNGRSCTNHAQGTSRSQACPAGRFTGLRANTTTIGPRFCANV